MSTGHIAGVPVELFDEGLSYEQLVSAAVESVRRTRATAPAAATKWHEDTARVVIEAAFIEELGDVDRDVVCRVVMWVVAAGFAPMFAADVPVPPALNVMTFAALRYGGHLPPLPGDGPP